jgi:prevent-host-death family protein
MSIGKPVRVRNARGEMIAATEVSASDAKNAVGRILERVARDGGVTITRHREPFAVVIPLQTYVQLTAAESDVLDTLSAEFDALLERMQAPGMATAMQRAFDMPPSELGRAAAQAGRDENLDRIPPPRKRAAKRRTRRI